MKTESGSFSEGRATSLKTIGGMEEIRDARGIRDMMITGIIAAAALIPLLLWAPAAHAHPGHCHTDITIGDAGSQLDTRFLHQHSDATGTGAGSRADC